MPRAVNKGAILLYDGLFQESRKVHQHTYLGLQLTLPDQPCTTRPR